MAAGPSAEPVSPAPAVDAAAVPAAPTSQAAADTAAGTAAEAAAESGAGHEHSAADTTLDGDVAGTPGTNEAALASAGTDPPADDNQDAQLAAQLNVITDAEPAAFTIVQPAERKKRKRSKSSMGEKASSAAPGAEAGTSAEVADTMATDALTTGSQEAATPAVQQPVKKKRHRLSHSTGPEDPPAAGPPPAQPDSAKLKKKKARKSAAAAADDGGQPEAPLEEEGRGPAAGAEQGPEAATGPGDSSC